MADILVSVSVAAFGTVGAGLLARLLAPLFWKPGGPDFGAAEGLLVLVPAHDEEAKLPATLEAIRVASGGRRVRVVVGADACTDGTTRVAERAGAAVIAVDFRSKWRTLSALAAQARPGEWVALVDAGALWPASLLQDLEPLLSDRSVAGIAPAYYPARASLVERSLWRIEAAWKNAENAAGGPVSVHGATVFLRAEALRAALDFLAPYRDTWLNDDVALPLAVRLCFPRASFRYWCPPATERRVSDLLGPSAPPGFGRRRRMVAGNLEWALSLLPVAFARAPAAGLVALRRLFRIFWAWWGVLFAYAAARCFFADPGVAVLATVSLVASAGLVGAGIGVGSLVEAAVASLLAPFHVPLVALGRSQSWS